VAETHGAEGAKLVRMANQIAAFFRSYPEAAAQEGVRVHLLSFWTPRMLLDLLEQAPGAQIDPLVRAILPALVRAATMGGGEERKTGA
jgi:formate dehydrogenase subunit delta